MKSYLFAILLAVLLICSCSQVATRYVMNMPSIESKPISGLDQKSKIILVTDRLNGQCVEGDNYFLVTESNKLGQKYTLNSLTGECTFNETIQIPKAGLYWDVLDEKKQSAGEVCIQTCLMSTPCGGKYSYGFSAERKFDCESGDKALVSYSHEHREETWSSGYGTTTTYYETASGWTQKFLIKGEVISIERYDGYTRAFNTSGNIKGSRFYAINDFTIIASCPDWGAAQKAIRTDMFLFDLKTKMSWGADLDFEKPYRYIDFFISSDKKKGYFVVLNEENMNYFLWSCPLDELVLNIKLLRIVN